MTAKWEAVKRSPLVRDVSSGLRRLRSRRLVAVVTLLGVVVAGLALDDPKSAVPQQEGAESELSAGAPPGVLSSAWYCPMVYATRAAPEAGGIVLANFGSYPVSATASVVPAMGPAVDIPVNVGARDRTYFNPGTVVDAPFAAVTVRVDGGGLAVEQLAGDNTGISTAPCATETSNQWHIADASTDGGDTRLGIYNPSDDYAIVDVIATTDLGRAAPVEYAGILVPARGMVVTNLGDQLRRRQWIAASVNARRGRVVVNQLETGVLRNAPGISIGMASSTPAVDTVLPTAMTSPGVTDRISVYNPSRKDTEVTVEITPENGTPITRTLFAGRQNRTAIDLETQPAVPRDTWTSVRVLSSSDIPVVAQRTNTAVAPSPFSGFTTSVGVNRPRERWIAASATTADPSDVWVWTHNPGKDPVEARILLIGQGVSQVARTITVEPGRSVGVHADELPDSVGKAVMVEADGPVMVSRQLRQLPGIQFSTTPAIPLR